MARWSQLLFITQKARIQEATQSIQSNSMTVFLTRLEDQPYFFSNSRLPNNLLVLFLENKSPYPREREKESDGVSKEQRSRNLAEAILITLLLINTEYSLGSNELSQHRESSSRGCCWITWWFYLPRRHESPTKAGYKWQSGSWIGNTSWKGREM